MTEIPIRDEPEHDRLVTTVEGQEAELRYRREGDRIRLTHTSVPEALEGRGIGSALARHALDSAREEGVAVWPECPFVAAYIRRHPEYLDLVGEDFPGRAELAADADGPDGENGAAHGSGAAHTDRS